jgi:phosphoenolpyruvate phosphomutase
MTYEQRRNVVESIKGAPKVIPKDILDYRDSLNLIKLDVAIHGDDKKEGVQIKIRQQVIKNNNKVLID